MKGSEIIKLLAEHTKSDDFTSCGNDIGLKNHEVVLALVECPERIVMLRALQVAFYLGVKFAGKLINRQIESGEYSVGEYIESLQEEEQQDKA